MLGHIDDLFLRHAAQNPEAVLCSCESHDSIKRLFKNCPARPNDRELMDRQTRHRLQHPRRFRIAKTGGGHIDQLIPFRLFRGGS